jgi:hypothetical protein
LVSEWVTGGLRDILATGGAMSLCNQSGLLGIVGRTLSMNQRAGSVSDAGVGFWGVRRDRAYCCQRAPLVGPRAGFA